MGERTKLQLGKRKTLAIEAAKVAGKILRDSFGKPIEIKAKGDRDLVTDVDLKAQREITTLIEKSYPKDTIISEEGDHCDFSLAFDWIIDPLDGTHNYIHTIPIFGVSIALAFKSEVVLGIIYLPMEDELYIAERGKGARCNGRKIQVSKRQLREATMVYDSSIRINKKPMLTSLGKLADEVFNVRMFGSTCQSLAYVANGTVEAEVEYNDKMWDFAAGLLLVEEAGGMVTDFQGNKWTLNTTRYIASNGIVHKDILEILQEGKSLPQKGKQK